MMLFQTPATMKSRDDGDERISMKLSDILGDAPDPDERINMSLSEFRSRIQKEEIRDHIEVSRNPKF